MTTQRLPDARWLYAALVVASRSASGLLALFEPALQLQRRDPDGPAKPLDRQAFLVDQLVDLGASQVQGLADLQDGPELRRRNEFLWVLQRVFSFLVSEVM